MPRYANRSTGRSRRCGAPSSRSPATGGSQAGAPGNRRGGMSMTFDQWLELVRTHWKREEGQTMAEYGVVLAVLTIGAVAVFTALSGGISGALNRVIGLLPS